MKLFNLFLFSRANSITSNNEVVLHPDLLTFKKKLVSSLVEVDIPLHKLSHLALKSLLATMAKVLPSETAACASVAYLASGKENQIRKLLQERKFFWLWIK